MKFAIKKQTIRERMKVKKIPRPEDLACHAGIAYATALKAFKGESVSATVFKEILRVLDLQENDLLVNGQLSISPHSARSNGGRS